MNTIGIKTGEPKERGNVSRTVPLLPLARGQREVALVEATRERERAALRISELSRQAVDTLHHLAERAAHF